MRLLLAVLLLLLLPGVAAAQDADTGGVPQADADAACAAVVGQDPPTAEQEQAFRDAYNTTDNTDDGPASEGVSAEWQRLIYLQELHIDYGGPMFTCEAGVAVGLVAEPGPEPEPEPQPGDECTDPVSGQPGTVNENGNCVQDRAPFETCQDAYDALTAGTFLEDQFPLTLVDGTVCELPAPPTSTTPPTEPPAATEPPAPDLNCEDYPLPDGTTAQQALDADPTDPHGLDEDGDGAACETDLGVIPADPPVVDGQFTSGADNLAYTGASIGWLLGGGAALLALGVGALWFARRRGAEIH